MASGVQIEFDFTGKLTGSFDPVHRQVLLPLSNFAVLVKQYCDLGPDLWGCKRDYTPVFADEAKRDRINRAFAGTEPGEDLGDDFWR